MRVGFHTFGCKLNQYETEALASSLREGAIEVVSAAEEADLYIVNTCTVTARADHKGRAMIRSLARRTPRAMVVVTGCAAELDSRSLASLAENIVVVPQSSKTILLELPKALREGAGLEERLRALCGSAKRPPQDPFALQVKGYSFHTRAFLKIQDGCDCRCTYCRVPLARGTSVSMQSGLVVARAIDLEESGHREIVLTGVNISAYRSGSDGLASLLPRILAATKRARVRLSSLEPESVSDELARALSAPRICPHFHIPVQSGSDQMLALMGRRYRREAVIKAAGLLRSSKEDPFLAADIIVGFPGESDQDYQDTKDLVQGIGFSSLHVFPFSPRPGTPAASLGSRVPQKTSHTRAMELRRLSRVLHAQYARRWIGREVEALLEPPEETGGLFPGTTANFLKLCISGVPSGHGSASVGRIARVRVAADCGVGTARGAAQLLDFAD